MQSTEETVDRFPHVMSVFRSFFSVKFEFYFVSPFLIKSKESILIFHFI